MVLVLLMWRLFVGVTGARRQFMRSVQVWVRALIIPGEFGRPKRPFHGTLQVSLFVRRRIPLRREAAVVNEPFDPTEGSEGSDGPVRGSPNVSSAMRRTTKVPRAVPRRVPVVYALCKD